MGNLYNTKTGILGMLEEHSNKQRTSTNVDIVHRNSNQKQKKVSEPRNIKKDDIEIQHHRISPSSVGTQQILAKLHGLSIERVSFEQIWNRSQQLLARSLKFTLMFPQPLNSQGQELLKNGSFFVYWLKILQKNPCVNMNMVYKNVRQRYQPNVTHEKSYLEEFLKQQQNIHQTPLKKTNSNDSTLKRSALKKSDKRVQFGKNQIIYPYLQQYKNLNISIQNKKQITRSQQAFLLDYFEINDIYLLEQVTIVGVLKEFDDTYAIVQVKLNKEPTKELTCIGITSKQNIKSHSLRILQEIQKQYQNLCFLELDANQLKQL